MLSQPDAKHYLSASDVGPFPQDPFFEDEEDEEEEDNTDDKDSDDS